MGHDIIEVDFSGLEIGFSLEQLEALQADVNKARVMVNQLTKLIEQIDKIDFDFIEETAMTMVGDEIFEHNSFEAYFADIHDPVNTITEIFDSWDKHVESLIEKKKSRKPTKLTVANVLRLKADKAAKKKAKKKRT